MNMIWSEIFSSFTIAPRKAVFRTRRSGQTRWTATLFMMRFTDYSQPMAESVIDRPIFLGTILLGARTSLALALIWKHTSMTRWGISCSFSMTRVVILRWFLAPTNLLL